MSLKGDNKMIRNAVCNENKPWLEVDSVELTVGNMEVVIDADYIGIFTMCNFSESYENCLSSINRIRHAGYFLMEIHKDLIGEIEVIFNHMDINYVNVKFKDGHMELFTLPDEQRFRITSLGDLRIECGELGKEASEYDVNQAFKNRDFSINEFFGKNWTIGSWGLPECIHTESKREGENGDDSISHDEAVITQTEALLDVLGEIVNACGGKKISKQKLIALATLVDYNVLETIDVKQYTYIDEILRNLRIEQFKQSDYIGRTVSDSYLKEVIHRVCGDFKNKKIQYMLDEINNLEFEEYEILRDYN